ncbi:hypothetical protein MCC93_10600 [Morococcus cerebrosus]|uniref:Uncharacterized protein n=1 Tax=Morococcus cerebrosus TaxID=1056807 RepID=A0A0C1EJH7_9NEIS|nr:hypothetical protein MCC93_10600 [Morococcus cerebrosus]
MGIRILRGRLKTRESSFAKTSAASFAKTSVTSFAKNRADDCLLSETALRETLQTYALSE